MISWLLRDPCDINFQISHCDGIWCFNFHSRRSVLWFDLEGAFDKEYVDCVFKKEDSDVIYVLSSSEFKSLNARNRFLSIIPYDSEEFVSESYDGYSVEIILESLGNEKPEQMVTDTKNSKSFGMTKKPERLFSVSDMEKPLEITYNPSIQLRNNAFSKNLDREMREEKLTCMVYQYLYFKPEFVFAFNVRVCQRYLDERGMTYNLPELKYILCDAIGHRSSRGSYGRIGYYALGYNFSYSITTEYINWQSGRKQEHHDILINPRACLNEKYAVFKHFEGKPEHFVCYYISDDLLMFWHFRILPRDILLCLFNALC